MFAKLHSPKMPPAAVFRAVAALLCALVVLTALSIVASSPARAQQPPFDLAVEITNSLNGNWIVTARNLGAETAFGVTVQVDLPDQVIVLHSDRYDPSTGVWRIGRLDGGSSETLPRIVTKLAPGLVPSDSDTLAVPARAVISNTFPVEPPLLRYNNSAEGWTAATPIRTIGPARASVALEAALDNPLPEDSGTVTLALNLRLLEFVGGTVDSTVYGAKVKIRLPPGLGQPTGQSAGTTFTPVPDQARTWEWALETIATTAQNVGIKLAMAVPSGADVEGKCITAELTVERPADDPSDNTVRVCFEDPPTLFQTGETDLLTLYDCVGVTTAPARARTGWNWSWLAARRAATPSRSLTRWWCMSPTR